MREETQPFEGERSDEDAPKPKQSKPFYLGDTKVYSENNELFQEHFKDQYMMYVEMADRISARRHLANVFFLSLQTTIISILAFAADDLRNLNEILLKTLVLTMILVCVAWWWILRSYRNLNSAKYKVIGKMEESLPASPYWKEEWKELGEGKDYRKYLPLTVIEQFLPIIFGLMYLVLAFILPR